MISPKDATNAAIGYFHQLVDAPVENLILEEIELSSDELTWKVTLGFSFPEFRGLGFPISTPRQYKIFDIDAISGAVKSMKIRKLE